MTPVMLIPSNRSFTDQDLASLRRLIARSHANSTKHSWVRLVDTQSMSPSVDGDIDLLIEWTQPYHFREGDIIVVSKPTLPFLLAHRACQCRPSPYGYEILQIADQFIHGDDISASWIELQAVLGRVTRIRFSDTGRTVSLDSPPIRWLSSWIAKLSTHRLTHSQPQAIIQRLINHVITVQHRLACYIFRAMLYLTACLACQAPSTSIDRSDGL